LRCPLQHGFNSDGKRSFSVTIHDHTTSLTLVKSIVSKVMSVVHCTAVRTPLGGMVGINDLKRNARLLTIRFKETSKLSIGNQNDLPISLFAKPAELSSEAKLFNGNGGTIRLGKVHNFLGNLTASCLDIISLLVLNFFEVFLGFSRAFIGMGLKFPLSLHISSLFFGNIRAKVKLFDRLRGLGIKDGNSCKGGGADINSNNKPSIVQGHRKYFFENDGNPSIMQEGDVFIVPSFTQEGFKSRELSIESDVNYKRFARGISDLKTRIASLRCNEFEPSLIKPDGAPLKNRVDRLSLSPDIFSGFLYDVGGQKGGLTYV